MKIVFFIQLYNKKENMKYIFNIRQIDKTSETLFIGLLV